MPCDNVVVITQEPPLVLLGKNSDRPSCEEQRFVYIPEADHDAGSVVRATYIEIPQVNHTNALVLSQPAFMWGGEMGVNQFGVAIGNEAVFCREPVHSENTKLLGMDMVRLALERSANADESLDVLLSLLETHGQGGCCYGPGASPGSYHNSFLVADRTGRAWLLETAGEYWAAELVIGGVRTISNCLSITTPTRAHPDAVSHAVERGWCRDASQFNWTLAYTETSLLRYPGILNRVCRGSTRARTTQQFLTRCMEDHAVTPADVMALLRSHAGGSQPWMRSNVALESVCAHDGAMATMQTTNSLVADLTAGITWTTASAAPCTALYKPVTVANAARVLPLSSWCPSDVVAMPRYDDASRWWRHERIHRTCLMLDGAPPFAAERDKMESRWLAAASVDGEWCAAVWAEADAKEGEWLAAIDGAPRDRTWSVWRWWYASAWNARNSRVGMHF